MTHMAFLPNWASWIRTNEYSSQSAVPYRLAIAQNSFFIFEKFLELVIECRFIIDLSDVDLLDVIWITIIYLYNDIHSSYYYSFMFILDIL